MTVEPPSSAKADGINATTLDAIFQVNTRRTPDAIALIDPVDRAAFTDGHALRVTYAAADQAVTAMANRLRQLGLTAGAVVGLQLPNTVESVIALLAVLRAGLVAAPLPLLWRRTECARALTDIGARALITCRRVGDTEHAEIALHIAADTFSIRFVCAFGAGVPDGIVPLDDIWNAGCAAEHDVGGGGVATDSAIITFDVGPDGPVAVAHTHAELLVSGLAVVLEAGLSRQADLFGTMLTSSFAVLSATVVTWLLTGGTLALHQPFATEGFLCRCRELCCDTVILPGPLLAPLIEDSGSAEVPVRFIAVWRSPERQAASPVWNAKAAATIDLLAFGELGIVALRRGADGAPAQLTRGPVRTPSGSLDGAIVMTIDRTAAGTLALGGPMVPMHLRSAGGGQADSGHACRIDPVSGALQLSGVSPGTVSVGGYRFSLRELQDLIGQVDANGLLATLPDLLSGEKLGGLAADTSAMRVALATFGINPLVGEAFRDRQGMAKTG